MRQLLVFAVLLLFFQCTAQSQPDNASQLRIIDVSQVQLRVMNAYRKSDSVTRSRAFADSIYKPYVEFWSGYIGGLADFLDWMNTSALPFLDTLNKRNKVVDGKKLLPQFNAIKKNMIRLTGYAPRGKWFMAYGPGWTDLGSLGNEGTMLIDLSHSNNKSSEIIKNVFPHEITHQIMSNVNKHIDSAVLGPVIGEGFAVYMNQLYWKNRFTLAQNLGYSEKELEVCIKKDTLIKRVFAKYKFSTDKEVIQVFRSRSERIASDLPGAIGYYIGYRIVEAYVKNMGKNSWKDVFTKSPREIYELSRYGMEK